MKCGWRTFWEMIILWWDVMGILEHSWTTRFGPFGVLLDICFPLFNKVQKKKRCQGTNIWNTFLQIRRKKRKLQRSRKKISCTKLSFKLQMERYWSVGKFTAVNICSLSVICILSSCSVFSHCQYLVYFVFRPIWSSRLLWLQLTNHLAMFLSTRELPRSRG